ncbi:MAG: hypothetical protein V3U13_04250 [Gemmatimonadota bacterium]
MLLATLILTLAFFAAPLPAQELERPTEWKVRFDRPAPDSAVYFVSMPPGWHITTGPACILFDPAQAAAGEFRLESKIYLFPGERREGFGIFIGGENLDKDNQSYLYFLIRKDGRFLIKHRAGSETHTIIPWTENSAIVKHPGGDERVENVLSIDAGAEEVDFLVNGAKVASLPRAQMNVDGIVGLRVNHGLNLHVAELTVRPKGGGR